MALFQKHRVFLILLLLSFNTATAQQTNPAVIQGSASLTGRVIDAGTGDPMNGVVVLVKGTQIYTVTDAAGTYFLTGVPEGQQTILFQIFSFKNQSYDLTFTANESKRLNLSMGYETAKGVTIKARQLSDTEAALLAEQKKAPVSQDAISAEMIGKTPDSDAADTTKRVTGVTIVGGDDVFIRGLGERYSAVMFADSLIPSPDPDKRVVPLDIFPTGLLDNIIVIKSFNVDMPGDFAGGIVKINPKDYPEEEEFKVAVGTGYSFGTTFENFLTYDGGMLNWFGLDDGTRGLPDSVPSKDLDSYAPSVVEQVGEDFKNVYTPTTMKALPKASVSFNYGNSYRLTNGGTLGIIFSGLFKESFDNKELFSQILSQGGDPEKNQLSSISEYSTTKGILGSIAYKDNFNAFRFTTFLSHNSADKAIISYETNDDKDEATTPTNTTTVKHYKLQYVSEGLWFNQLTGNHNFPESETRFNWQGSYALAFRYEPDTRTSELYDDDSTGEYYVKDPNNLQRYFQDHLDHLAGGDVEVKLPFTQWNGIKSDLSIGASFDYRLRVAHSRLFSWQSGAPGSFALTPEQIEDLFNDSTIVGSTGDAAGNANLFFLREITGQSAPYTGSMVNAGGYVKIDTRLFPAMRFSGGIRYEYSDMDVEIFNQVSNELTGLGNNPLTPHNILPALNFTLEVTDDMNLRLSGAKTLIRPDFREVTPNAYNLLESGAVVYGNTNLSQTDIYNADFRWEWFPSTEELIAVSAFYKYLIKPIEILNFPGASGQELYGYVNAQNAQNMGFELEVRKNFGFIAQGLEDLSLTLNFTYILSSIEVDNRDIINAGLPLTSYANPERPLQGQSPYIINVVLDYDSKETGLSGTFLFNVAGPYIETVEILPSTNSTVNGDIYAQPVPILDFVLKKELGDHHQIKLKVKNILDPEVKQTQRIDVNGSDTEHVVKSYTKGRSIDISYGYSF